MIDTSKLYSLTFPLDHFFFFAPLVFFDAWEVDAAALAAAFPCFGAMIDTVDDVYCLSMPEGNVLESTSLLTMLF